MGLIDWTQIGKMISEACRAKKEVVHRRKTRAAAKRQKMARKKQRASMR